MQVNKTHVLCALRICGLRPCGFAEILDGKRLETFACECYGVIQQLNGELGLK
jgi:hypothetical protein